MERLVTISRLASGLAVGLLVGAFAGAYVVGATPHPGFCPCSACAGQVSDTASAPGAEVDPISGSVTERF